MLNVPWSVRITDIMLGGSINLWGGVGHVCNQKTALKMQMPVSVKCNTGTASCDVHSYLMSQFSVRGMKLLQFSHLKNSSFIG